MVGLFYIVETKFFIDFLKENIFWKKTFVGCIFIHPRERERNFSRFSISKCNGFWRRYNGNSIKNEVNSLQIRLPFHEIDCIFLCSAWALRLLRSSMPYSILWSVHRLAWDSQIVFPQLFKLSQLATAALPSCCGAI